ncbi:TfdA family taurine catabolism dioxygenase TauD [Truncatella angustata]|uniref:TfdA family taurine catabolism dioxygenase TauD n=1 Tax=Truncatella angustata TaxID=152316 RepID=A0A9P8RFT3_9PEZI|nr:TfdA family taurine catabolism dioxygenase TauD [Truncatella angustata]KAH6645044.1 TfdA family taurine catabolism dioxygenase TauD [Truncatella angustata]KAH8194086.1 hypothetical protein TruAng_011749 [Truncatella angustata]
MSSAVVELSFENSRKPARDQLLIPERTRKRFEAAGIDLSNGYPAIPPPFQSVQEAESIFSKDRDFVDRGTFARKDKKALFEAAEKVIHLTNHVGTEIVGLQLKDLTDEQKDDLALLIAERCVVFFRDQEISPQEQVSLAQYLGELYPQGGHVPGLPEVAVIWPDFFAKTIRKPDYRNPFQGWHTDVAHERYPPGITHLHMDAVPEFGGDLLWASGYDAYSKLSPKFRKMIDGLHAVVRSRESFPDLDKPNANPRPAERVHPLVRVHPVTGWKSLYLSRAWTVRIVGLDKSESDLILSHLLTVYENNADTQVRFKWTPGSSALWDNRISLHTASWDYENKVERHGTRVTILGEEPYFDEKATSRRVALGLEDPQ